jgi:hypothetical protein
MSGRRINNSEIDELISDVEEAKEEFSNLFVIQPISSAEESHQHTVPGAEEEKNSNSSDSESTQEPRSANEEPPNKSSTSFNKEAAAYNKIVGDRERARIEIEQLEREDPFNAYKEEEYEEEKTGEDEQDNN